MDANGLPPKVRTGLGLISCRISGISPKCFKRFGKMLAALIGVGWTLKSDWKLGNNASTATWVMPNCADVVGLCAIPRRSTQEIGRNSLRHASGPEAAFDCANNNEGGQKSVTERLKCNGPARFSIDPYTRMQRGCPSLDLSLES